MILDEWGTWYQAEPGTHPKFLYQQNTMRDAIVAAVSLDVFNRHCDRVRMANIAQNAVTPRAPTEVAIGADALQVTLPKMSVAVIEIA